MQTEAKVKVVSKCCNIYFVLKHVLPVIVRLPVLKI